MGKEQIIILTTNFLYFLYFCIISFLLFPLCCKSYIPPLFHAQESALAERLASGILDPGVPGSIPGRGTVIIVEFTFPSLVLVCSTRDHECVKYRCDISEIMLKTA